MVQNRLVLIINFLKARHEEGEEVVKRDGVQQNIE